MALNCAGTISFNTATALSIASSLAVAVCSVGLRDAALAAAAARNVITAGLSGTAESTPVAFPAA